MATNSILDNEPKIVKTDEGAIDGQNKCPSCGATDISVNAKTGKLRCNFCRHEFEPEKVEGLETDLTKLEGEIIGSGTQDIQADAQNVVTLKCSSCGAEVVIDTSESTQARCHWCRNTLSINEQIPNGSIPDVVLPFNLTKADAKQIIENFVGKRKFFAHPKFREEFTTDNIMGVYFPYMVVDVNSHARLIGQGEHEVRRYTRGSGDNRKTYYDADLYDVEREFDLTIEGLTVESSSDKLNKHASDKTNNVINAIMPFDIENCVKYNANYLKGYTSEKRDTNIDDLRPIVDAQSKDIARFAANETLKDYDRG
ncbi:MAG: TFIIB-type zinc ribbon-containing protein, partial [Clostridiales bacterium]|nr:TFIIB-type zinc ribbon-containing protein [Clostridiales bacterium]